MKHVYWVSYAAADGVFGGAEVAMSLPLDTLERVDEARARLADSSPRLRRRRPNRPEDFAVISWTLMRTEGAALECSCAEEPGRCPWHIERTRPACTCPPDYFDPTVECAPIAPIEPTCPWHGDPAHRYNP